VGLIVANNAHIGPLLANLIEHYAHFRRSAVEFSRRWLEKHGAERTLATLLDPGSRNFLNPTDRGAGQENSHAVAFSGQGHRARRGDEDAGRANRAPAA
jgi:hypothetical protein